MAVAAPPTIATSRGPTTTSAPIRYMSTIADSVVCPGSLSGSDCMSTTFPVTMRAATANSPPTMTHGVVASPTSAAMAPAHVTSAKVLSPASGDSARSFCSPTSKPNPRAMAISMKVVLSMPAPSLGRLQQPHRVEPRQQ
jgi:hypothetical protein